MATGSSGGSFSTTTIVNSSPATTSTPERRAELLRHARKSRLQWILNGLDDTHRSATLKSHSTTLADLYRKIPAAECLQQIINFLTTVIDDGEVINIEALVPPEGLDEDFDEKLPLPTYETCLGMDPYLIFIEKLKHPLSIDIVKLLQQFITKIEIMMRLENQNMSSTYPPMKNQPQDIDEKISQDIWAFLKQIHGNMRDNLLWKSETTEQWNNSMISCEKFLFIKLYDCLFGNDMKLLEQDERIRERIESLSFLSPDHLDMKSLQYEWTRRRTVSEENLEKQIGGVSRIQHATDELTIGKVVKKLRSISQERCPSDKVWPTRHISLFSYLCFSSDA